MYSTSGALRSRIISEFSGSLCTLNTLTNSPILHVPQAIYSQNTKKQPIIFFAATTAIPIRPFSVISRTDHDGRGEIVARFSTMSTGGDDARETVNFQLSPSSFLKIQKGDITQWSIDGSSDAIVNPANEQMLGGGGADGAIHRAAGPELKDACYEVPEVRPGVRCPTGEARITPGFRLPASHVIHTVGPIYDTDENPEASLRNAYRNSLSVAKENNIQYIAFPAISCGVYRYPLDDAAAVALSTVKEFGNDLKEVHFVLFSDAVYDAWSKKARELFEDLTIMAASEAAVVSGSSETEIAKGDF